MAMSRPAEGSGHAKRESAEDPVLKEWLPYLHDWITETQWDDGKARRTTTVMVLTEDGVWKLWVHDRNDRRSAWVTGTAWEEVWERLEKQLREGTVEWRADKR